MIKIKNILLVVFVLNTLFSYSQDKEYNIIISVDNNLRNVYADKIFVTDKEGKTDLIRVNYVQGNLSIKNDDFEKLASDNVAKIDLVVRYDKICKDKIETINYDIENFKLAWLNKGTHFVLYIYDIRNKKYRKIYNPILGKKFTYEYDWSEGSMRRVQKRLTKNQKKCLN